MGALLLLAAMLGAALLGGGPKKIDEKQPVDELGKRVARFRSSGISIWITQISSGQFGWYAYDGSGGAKQIGSGSEADDDLAILNAWEFMQAKIAANSPVDLSILDGQGGERANAEIYTVSGGEWGYSAKVGGLSSVGTSFATRGVAIKTALEWIEGHLAGPDGAVGEPLPTGKYSGNGITIDEECKSIFVTDPSAFAAFAKPHIEQSLSGSKPPSAILLGQRTIGPAAGLLGCPRPQTVIDGRTWASIEPEVRELISAMTKPDWLAVAEPSLELAYAIIGKDPMVTGEAERFRGRALVIRPLGALYEALIFPGPARTLDEDAERVTGATLQIAKIKAHQRVVAEQGGVIGSDDLLGPKPGGDVHVPQPDLPSPDLPQGGQSSGWACATSGYNPQPKVVQLPSVGWAARKTYDVEMFRIDGQWSKCTSYDVRVGVCLRALVFHPYGELSSMLASWSTADMSKVPIFETEGGTLSQDEQWSSPPTWKIGLRARLRKIGGAWKIEGDITTDDGTTPGSNACPGAKAHWPIPRNEHFNVLAEDGTYQRWNSEPRADLIVAGNRVILRVNYTGTPQLKRFGNNYRARYVATPLTLAARINAKGSP